MGSRTEGEGRNWGRWKELEECFGTALPSRAAKELSSSQWARDSAQESSLKLGSLQKRMSSSHNFWLSFPFALLQPLVVEPLERSPLPARA